MPQHIKATNGQPGRKKGFKFDWGMKIALAFILFCSFIIYMVVRAFQQNIDLVSDTYYLDELAYQDRITAKSNLAMSGLEVKLEQSESDVILTFPEAFKEANGQVRFYHPSEKIFDREFAIILDDRNQQLIAKDRLIKGRFKVQISWMVDSTPYFQEKDIFLK